MPAQVGLSDGTKIAFTEEEMSADDVVEILERSATGFVILGAYRVRPSEVVYVRDVSDAGPLVGFK
jgi:hypothetical protein